eukprot:CAMPEP_0172470972 /NCGR_PEP_ID=MMETSP1065-20121228/67575_1 /TAXON_ID=265537 /ORGANISM="Amphiprora paludosa, Strain CCMP125" /LENGTH=201 /DNA_ID=CAMNT_0013229053 /DNA_START=33 /DNA_END=635 /DNA_ORIENTATION=+
MKRVASTMLTGRASVARRATLESCCFVHHGPQHPSKSTPWERKALQVKDTDVQNPYMDLIRDTHDPSMQLKTLEDELKGTIGKALGKQGEKILDAMRKMKDKYDAYEKVLTQHDCVQNHPEVIACAHGYNEVQKEAVKARWELIVHRQAIGMIVNNHKFVMDQYPISDPIPIPKSKDESDGESSEEKVPVPKKKFGDQLDW